MNISRQTWLDRSLNRQLTDYLNSARNNANVFVRMENDRINRTERVFLDDSSDNTQSQNKPKHTRRRRKEYYKPYSSSWLNLDIKNGKLDEKSMVNPITKYPIKPYYWHSDSRNSNVRVDILIILACYLKKPRINSTYLVSGCSQHDFVRLWFAQI